MGKLLPNDKKINFTKKAFLMRGFFFAYSIRLNMWGINNQYRYAGAG